MAPVKTVNAAPRAAALMEGIRDFGYSLGAALADIIDSHHQGGNVHQRGNRDVRRAPYIAIIDDGEGMTRAELLAAMVSRDPARAKGTGRSRPIPVWGSRLRPSRNAAA